MGLRDFIERLVGSPLTPSGQGGARVTGAPPSGNGASSFHLTWEAPPVPLLGAEVTIEVIEPPTVDQLYFWALQVNFERGGGRVGGAHFGLQYHPAYPDAGAVNWGGYADVGGELDGSTSELPSALGNVNTRTYRWEAGRRYRYRIGRAPESEPATETGTDSDSETGDGAPANRWRGSIVDEVTGIETVVRDLFVDADTLSGPMVWSEIFAHCDHPTAAVRWSGLTVHTADGRTVEVDTVRLNYQTNGDGGCANTNTSVDLGGPTPGFVQRSNAERTNPTGARLRLR